MDPQIPTAADIQSHLAELSHAEVHSLARTSSVPFTTLWNIRSGVTSNPGVETVRKFFCHIEGVKAQRNGDSTSAATQEVA